MQNTMPMKLSLAVTRAFSSLPGYGVPWGRGGLERAVAAAASAFHFAAAAYSSPGKSLTAFSAASISGLGAAAAFRSSSFLDAAAFSAG